MPQGGTWDKQMKTVFVFLKNNSFHVQNIKAVTLRVPGFSVPTPGLKRIAEQILGLVFQVWSRRWRQPLCASEGAGLLCSYARCRRAHRGSALPPPWSSRTSHNSYQDVSCRIIIENSSLGDGERLRHKSRRTTMIVSSF